MEQESKKADWGEKFKEMFGIFSREVKRTKEIGAQMLGASRVNSELNFIYQELGKKVFSSLKSLQLNWDNGEVQEMVKKVEELQERLKELEEEIRKLKQEGKSNP